jgi:hypothetical protein
VFLLVKVFFEYFSNIFLCHFLFCRTVARFEPLISGSVVKCVTAVPLAPGNSYSRGRISTIDLLVLNKSELILVLKMYFFPFYKTSYLNKEVNRTEPFPILRVPWCRLPNNYNILKHELLSSKLESLSKSSSV